MMAGTMTEQPVTYQQVTVSEAAGDTDATARAQPVPDVSRTNATAPELMAAWSETFLAPIMARMAEQETTIREQAETIGELRARLAVQQP